MSKHKNYSQYYAQNKEQVEEPKEQEIEATEEVEVPQPESEVDEAEKESEVEQQVKEVKSAEKLLKAIVFGASKVNMRLDSSKEAPVSHILSSGTPIIILDKSSYGDWYQIMYKNHIGYMMSKYVKILH